MRVNLYLWNNQKFRTFAQAVEGKEVKLLAHYIEKGSKSYHRVNTSNALILATTGLDVVYSVKEVSFASDEING